MSLVFLNFQLPAKMLNFIFIEVAWTLGYLRWLNFVQENWLRGQISCLHWKWLIFFRICQTFHPKYRSWGFKIWNFYDSYFYNRTQLKPKNQVLHVRKTVWTSSFLLEGWISYQKKKKKKNGGKRGLTWTQFLDRCCWKR